MKRYTKGNFALYQFQLAFQREMKRNPDSDRDFLARNVLISKNSPQDDWIDYKGKTYGGEENMLYLDCGGGYDDYTYLSKLIKLDT